MTRAGDTGPLRKLVEAMEETSCFLGGSISGGVRQMSPYFALS